MTVRRLVVDYRLEEPIVLNDAGLEGAQATGCLDYLPGSRIRGAVARALMEQGVEPTGPRFTDIFLSGGVRFGSAFITAGERQYLPVPLTAVTCKAYGGFLGDTIQGETHGVRDIALEDAVAMESSRPTRPRTCPRCGSRLEGLGGLRTADGNRGAHPTPRFRRDVRTAIDRRTGTAAAGFLFERMALHAGQNFRGCIDIDEQVGADSEATIRTGLDRMLIGAETSRGRGRVSVVIREAIQAEQIDHIGTRLAELNDRARAMGWEASHHDDRHMLFTLTTTDYLIPDPPPGHDAALWVGQEVVARLGCEGVHLVDCTSRAHVIRGWSDAWRLPKPPCLALAPGSVFVFGCREEDRALVSAGLATLQATGLGQRRSEGFGSVIACDEFHLLDEFDMQSQADPKEVVE